MRRPPAASRRVEGALRAFLDTDLDLYIQGGEGWRNYGALGAQVANTPEWGAELMDQHFDPVVLRLIGLLKKALPDCCRGGHLLGLSLRHRRADADAGAHRPHRQTVRRPVPVRGFRGGEGAHGHLHGRGLSRHLRRGREAGRRLRLWTNAQMPPCRPPGLPPLGARLSPAAVASGNRSRGRRHRRPIASADPVPARLSPSGSVPAGRRTLGIGLALLIEALMLLMLLTLGPGKPPGVEDGARPW